MLICSFCAKTFQYPSNLTIHMRSHTKEKPHKCLICTATFGLKSTLNKHVRSVHDGVKITPKRNTHCSLCSYKCYSKTILQRHLRSKHSAETPFACTVPGCEFKTKHETAVKLHVSRVHSDSDDRPFECPYDGCKYKAKYAQSLKKHLNITHSSEKPFICNAPGCSFASKSKSELTIHTSRVHSDVKSWKCSACNYCTKTKYDLSRHQFCHTKTKQFQCQAPKCGFACSQKYSLKLHFKRQHMKKNLLCTEPGCKYRCSSIVHLKEHLKGHEKPLLKCPDRSCYFSTRFKASLLSHIARRHKDTQSSLVVEKIKFDVEIAGKVSAMDTLHCRYPNCGYHTKLPHQYHQHRMSHKQEEKRNHVCKLCFSRFNKPSQVKEHLQRHFGEKPYKCSYCNHTSVSSVELRRHAGRLHHVHVIPRRKENEVRNCCTCNQRYLCYSEFVLHSMTHLTPVVVLERLRVQVV